ncbi:hypothetical protein C3K47_09430 [Solitalea longa]|uniref:Uncharacterized protein n=1 Tax=Solitalea longa TaxID=2079460 RepID=A0A2S5A2S2_9SPHI|nr:hypothetical protein [Solitalea longa]POY36587.1 hypothetical protein C3K47_09430 [Solitalea longa]
MDTSKGNESNRKISSANQMNREDLSSLFKTKNAEIDINGKECLLIVPEATIFNEMLKKSLAIRDLLLKLKENLT